MDYQTKTPVDPQLLKFIQSNGEYHEDDEANLDVSDRKPVGSPLMINALKIAGGALAMTLIAISRLF